MEEGVGARCWQKVLALGDDVVGERRDSLLDGGASKTTNMPYCGQAAKEEKKEKEEDEGEEEK